MATWSWIGRNAGSVESASSPAFRSAGVAIYPPWIPPFVRIMSASSRPRSSRIASASPGIPAFLGYRLNSRSSALVRIASRIDGWTGRVFVFWDIQATSWRCSCANSKLSLDVIESSLGADRGRHPSYRFWSNPAGANPCARDLTAVVDGPPMTLGGRKVVVLAEDGYEDLELWVPYYRLVAEGGGGGLAGDHKQTYTAQHSDPV